MKLLRSSGLLAGLLTVSLAASAAAAPNVTVRVEGENATLLPERAVTLLDAPEPNTGCAGDSAAAAVEVATGGNWDRQEFVQTIMGETHDFSRNDYWSLWVWRNGGFVRGNGICDERLAEGEELLAHPDFYDENFEPTVLPLAVEGVPAAVEAGRPFTVTVVEYVCTQQYCPPGDGARSVRPGATVTAGPVSAITGDDGRATLALTQTGETTLRATRASNVPSESRPVRVVGPGEPVAAPCATAGDDGRCGTRDRRAPQARITGIAEKQRFARARAPRELTATVEPDASGLHAVKLRLTRRHGGRCQYFSGRRERFRRIRCGRGFAFKVGETADVSYLLPRRLPRGRYVLDVVAIDKALNRDPLARGRNRVVFFVR